MIKQMMLGIVFCFAQLSFAEELPLPETILAESQKGRGEMLMTLAHLERLAPTAGEASELFRYIMILDQLDEIRKGYGFEDFGANPVQKTGSVLTKQALKWLRFDKDDRALIELFLKWSTDQTRFSAIGNHSFHLAETTDHDRILYWSDVISRASEVLRDLNADAYVQIAFQEFHGAIAAKALKLPNLTDEEFLKLIQQSVSLHSLHDILLTLQREAYAADDVDRERILLTRTLATAAAARELPVALPLQLEVLPGHISTEIIKKILFSGGVPDTGAIVPYFETLGPEAYEDLLVTLEWLLDRGIENDQLDFMIQFTRQLDKRMLMARMLHKSERMRMFSSRLAIQKVVSVASIQGVYDGKLGDHTTRITIVKSSRSSLIVGINEHLRRQYPRWREFSFRSVSYDDVKGEFTAFRFLPDSPLANEGNNLRNYIFKFKLDDKTIKGEFFANDRREPVIAQRVEEFKRYDDEEKPRLRLPNLDGEYRGGGSLRLLLACKELQCSASLYFSDIRDSVSVNMNSGVYDGSTGAIYLTSGEYGEGNWSHLRGRIVGDKLEGEYIVGGSGRRLGPFVLKRIEGAQ